MSICRNECQDDSKPQCNKRNQHFYCTRHLDHKGFHSACGDKKHDFHLWEREQTKYKTGLMRKINRDRQGNHI